MNTLTVKNLSVGYGYQPVLSGLSGSLNGGEWVHYFGRNGVGKSTLLRVLAALKHPLDGEILWNGDPIQGIYRENYRQKIRYFGHDRALFRDLTVRDNWDLYSELFGLDGASDSKVAGEVSPHQTVTRLSQGETQRVELATFWPSISPVFILDEPFASLDRDCCDLLEEFFQRCVEQESLVITASPETVEGPDRQLKVTGEGTVVEI